MRRNRLDRLAPVAAFGNNIEIFFLAELRANPTTGQRFIVNDYGADLRHD